ncbi:MAG TPA: hypothetical protein PLU93_03735 [Treponemataceae bacterium]|nr:hypothetical protein [Treponemataceae bacterium]
MRKVKLLAALALAIAAIAATPLAAQSAATMTELLAKERADYSDFSYLVASSAGIEASPFEAYMYCDQLGSFPENAMPNGPITAGAATFFMMKNYGISGGLMWRLTGAPRYAIREFRALDLIDPEVDPAHVLSGRELIELVSAFAERFPDATLREAEVSDVSAERRKAVLKTLEGTK